MKKLFVLMILVTGLTISSWSQWIQLGIGLDWANARWISVIDVNNMYFGADYGGFGTKIFKTTDAGNTWTLTYGNSNHDTKGGGKMFINGTGYAAFNDKVMKSIDYGSTWTQIFQTGAGVPYIRSIAFIDQNVGYAFYWQSGTGLWTVVKTTNGSSWNTVYQSSTMEFNQYNCAMFLNETTGCIPGYWGHLYKTTNGGTSWIDMMLPEEVFRVYMADANVIYAVSGMLNANVYKTTNGGSTWDLKTVPSTVPLMDIWFVSPNTGWVCASDGKIFRTDDGGDSWVLQSTPASYLKFISFADINNGWSLGSQSMTIHTSNGGITILPPTVVTDPATNVSYSTADLNGTVNANNNATTVTFDYGLSTAYGTIVSATPGTVTGNTNTTVMASISGLTQNTLYHYRCVGTNSVGTTYGNDAIFTTLCEYPGAAGPISGADNVCIGDVGEIYSVDQIVNATSYFWDVPPGAIITSGNNSNMITVDFPPGSGSGDVIVYGTNICGNGQASSLPVFVNPVPPTPVITQIGDILYSSAVSGNQWYLNGSIIPGATGQVYVPLNPGGYYVIVTINGCSSQPSNEIFIVGINEKVDAEIIKIYPNPSNGILTIEFPKTLSEEMKLILYNSLGIIIETKIIPAGNSFIRKVDLNKYPDGVYFARISGCQKKKIFKILIQKEDSY